MDTRTSLFNGILLSSALLATGCGGGGSDNTATPDYTAPVAITQDNAVAIASSVLDGGSMADAYTGQNTYAKAGTTSTDKDASYQQISDLVRKNVIKAIGSRKTIASLPAGVVINDPATLCDSGSFYTSWNDANDNGIDDGGDSASIIFNNCTFTDTHGTSVENGSLTFTLNDMQGEPAFNTTDWVLSVSFNANLSVSGTYTDGSSMSLSFVGGATLASSYAQSTGTVSSSMSGSSLKMSITYSDPTYGSQSGSVELASFNFASSNNVSTGVYTADIDYTLRAAEIGGSVTVTTDPVFTGIAPNPPMDGSMVISGANGSSLTLTAYEGDIVTISINGGTPMQYTWAELGVIGEL